MLLLFLNNLSFPPDCFLECSHVLEKIWFSRRSQGQSSCKYKVPVACWQNKTKTRVNIIAVNIKWKSQYFEDGLVLVIENRQVTDEMRSLPEELYFLEACFFFLFLWSTAVLWSGVMYANSRVEFWVRVTTSSKLEGELREQWKDWSVRRLSLSKKRPYPTISVNAKIDVLP